jgi:glycerol-3-phosphate cytidylyltransferase-like family protein
MNMEERVEVVAACKYVEKVIPDAPLHISEEYMNKHKIDMVFHGHSQEEEEKYSKMYEIPSKMGKFTRTSYTSGVSTSEIIERIGNRFK